MSNYNDLIEQENQGEPGAGQAQGAPDMIGDLLGLGPSDPPSQSNSEQIDSGSA